MKTTPEDIRYQIALLEMTHVGPSIARKMINHFGSAQAIIEAPKEDLQELGETGKKLLLQRSNEEHLNFADAQLAYCERIGADAISFYSERYPYRLKQCSDAPLVLYQLGHCNLNADRIVAIVGTRNCSDYGKTFCTRLVEELKQYDVTIISGLAFGIDACAHRGAVQNEMYNIAVVAHGLDRLYPSDHKELANRIIQKGSILTDYPTLTNPDRENFPKRNRIVAGMADAVVVIESAIKGGSMITARLGNDYHKDVFALPGRVGDERSEGCNHLIKTNQAHLLEKVEDISYILGWEKAPGTTNAVQKVIDFDFTKEESLIVSIIEKTPLTIDEVAIESKMSINQVSTNLLMLELKGVVKQLPGKKYQIA